MTAKASDALARLRGAAAAPPAPQPASSPARSMNGGRQDPFRFVVNLEPHSHRGLKRVTKLADEALRGPDADPGRDQVTMAEIVRTVAEWEDLWPAVIAAVEARREAT